MATISEMNEMIQKSEWESLSLTNFPVLWGPNKEDFILTKAFFLDYFLDTVNILEMLKLATKSPEFYAPDFINQVIGSASALGFDRSIEFWRKYLEFFKDPQIKSLMGSQAFNGGVFYWTGKNSDYARFLMSDNDAYLYICGQITDYSNHLPKKIYDELSPEEKPLFKNVMNTSQYLSLENPPQLLDILESVKSVILFCDTHYSINSGDALVNIPQEEIENLIRGGTGEYPVNTLALIRWFRGNPQAKVPDFILEKFSSIYGKFIHRENILMNMSGEQIKKYAKNIDFNSAVVSGKISLNELEELFPGMLDKNLVGIRFYREEEILEAPEFFNPKDLLAKKCLYVTKSTFTKLNRAWGQKQRYDGSLTSFSTIMNGLMYSETTTLGEVEYLLEKCKPPRKELLDTIKSTRLGFSDIGNKFALIRKLFKKFQGV